MITKTEGYKTSDGLLHTLLSDAQAHQLEKLAESTARESGGLPVHDWIVANKDAILAILNPDLTKKRTRKPLAVKPATQPSLTQ